MPSTNSTIVIMSGNQGPGDSVSVNGAYITSFAFTNTSPVSIDYSIDAGSTFTSLASGSSVTLTESNPSNYRFRRTNVGASAVIHITASVITRTPLSNAFSGDAVLDIAAANSAAASAATATTIAAAVPAAVAAATATTIAAAIPAAAPAGGTGAAAGAWDTAANRDAAITTINDLRAYAVEQKADFDAVIADIADIRTKVNDIRTHAVEMDLNYEALLVDVADIRAKYAAVVTLANENKTKLNALFAALRENKVINT